MNSSRSASGRIAAIVLRADLGLAEIEDLELCQRAERGATGIA